MSQGNSILHPCQIPPLTAYNTRWFFNNCLLLLQQAPPHWFVPEYYNSHRTCRPPHIILFTPVYPSQVVARLTTIIQQPGSRYGTTSSTQQRKPCCLWSTAAATPNVRPNICLSSLIWHQQSLMKRLVKFYHNLRVVILTLSENWLPQGSLWYVYTKNPHHFIAMWMIECNIYALVIAI